MNRAPTKKRKNIVMTKLISKSTFRFFDLFLLGLLVPLLLVGCSSTKDYDIVNTEGIVEGWSLRIPTSFGVNENVPVKVLYHDKNKDIDYRFSAEMRAVKSILEAGLNLETDLQNGLPVEADGRDQVNASIGLRTSGRLGSGMSRRHPVWQEMKDRGLKPEDIYELRHTVLVLKDKNQSFSFTDDGGRNWTSYPYLVPRN